MNNTKENILIYYGLSELSTILKESINVHARFINELSDKYNIYYGTFISKNRVKSFLKLNIKDIIEFKYNNKSWKNYYNFLDEINDKYKFKKIITISMPILYNKIYRNYEDNIKNIYNNTIINDKYTTNFNFNFSINKRLMLLYYYTVTKNIIIDQVVLDPGEVHWNKFNNNNKLYYFYKSNNIPELAKNYMPNIEYGNLYVDINSNFNYTEKQINLINNKIYDFTFGFLTNDREERNKMYEDLYINNEIDKLFNGLKYNIYVNSPKHKINTLIGRKEYILMIKQSKYTLSITSFDKEEVSSRFFESIANDCIVLYHTDVKWEQVFSEHPDFLAIYKKYNLVTDIKSIPLKIKSLDYSKILNEIKNSNDYKKLKDINFYKKYFNQL